ncbi:MAG: hypothetical protein HY074_16375 [Deltaproteobacteria bacterium]|nr:hypothetical protein [Deltaproteobacteria bacterium]
MPFQPLRERAPSGRQAACGLASCYDLGVMTTLAHNPACNTACRVCHYKDLDYPAQLARKQSWARAKLARWSDVLREIVPAPEADRLQYRSKSWMRSQVGDDGSLSFGWFRGIQVQGKWRDEFVSWDTCPIQTAAIQEMICRLRQVLATQAPEFARNSLTGVWLGSPHVVVVARQPISEEVKKLDWQAILTPPFDRVWFHRNPQIEKKVFSKGGSIEALAPGPEVEALHPVRAFRQVATTLLARARRLAVESLLAHQPVLVVDLYCGTGALSGLLPSNVGWLGAAAARSWRVGPFYPALRTLPESTAVGSWR